MSNILIIHGVLMLYLVMVPMARRLQKLGHTVSFYNYPFFPKKKHLSEDLVRCVEIRQPNVIIGHSLGGVIAVNNANQFRSIKAIICLGPPLAGSSMARRIIKSPFRFFLSDAARATLVDGVTISQPKTHFISLAGSNDRFGIGSVFPIFKEPNDGTVALHETKINNLSYWEELEVGHTTFVYKREVVEVIHKLLSNCGI